MYYLGAYYDGSRWRLVTRELHKNRKHVEKLLDKYRESYKVKLIEFDGDRCDTE